MHLSGHNIHTKGRDDSPKALLTPDNDICTFGDFSNNIRHKSPATNHHKQPISNIFPHRSLIPVFIYIKKVWTSNTNSCQQFILLSTIFLPNSLTCLHMIIFHYITTSSVLEKCDKVRVSSALTHCIS